MFFLYELCGVVTNLLAGILGSKLGLKATLLIGVVLQIIGVVATAQVRNRIKQ